MRLIPFRSGGTSGRSRRLALLAAASVMFAATGVCAQTPPAKPAAPAAPAPAPAPAAPPPSQLAVARELVVACGISRSFDILIPQFMDRIGTSLTQTRPELIRDLNTVLEQLRPEFEAQSNEMIDSAALIYTQLMTETELKSAVDFFKSEAGRKYVDSQPRFMTDAVGAMQAWQSRIATHMVERVREEMRKKGHEL